MMRERKKEIKKEIDLMCIHVWIYGLVWNECMHGLIW